MKSLALKDILSEIDGCITNGTDNHIIKNITIHLDSLKNNTLFFDLKNKITTIEIFQEQFQFFESCILVTQNTIDFSKITDAFTIVKVSNVEEAYWKFINYYRGLFKMPVIGITGTCGKTTTKEMIKFILSETYKVHSTYLSENALILNRYYLMGIDDNTDVGVFEMGVAWPGNLADSCKYFKPTIGIITNIGIDHMMGCKTLENYIIAKEELLKGLQNKGVLILNADDENTKKIDLSTYKGKIIYFGFNEKADFRAFDSTYSDNGMKFKLQYKDQIYSAFVPGYGEHNISNALAAIASVYTIGFDIKQALQRLNFYTPVRNHLQISTGLKGSTIINDTWSSNPTSTEVALKVLKDLSQGKATIAVLGTMSQLADSSTMYHAKIGEKIVEKGIDILITIGDEAYQTGLRALEIGMDKKHVYLCNNSEEVHQVLSNLLDNNTIVLMKDCHDSLQAIAKKLVIK